MIILKWNSRQNDMGMKQNILYSCSLTKFSLKILNWNVVKLWVLKYNQRRQTLEKEEKTTDVNKSQKTGVPQASRSVLKMSLPFFKDIFPNASRCESTNQNCFIFFCTCLERRQTRGRSWDSINMLHSLDY